MPAPDYIADLRALIGNAPVNLMGAEELIFDVQWAELITLHTTSLRTLSNGHQASFYTALYRVTE